MKKRSLKQIKSDLARINLETKTLKQQMKTIANQYIKLGRAIPKKIQENRANKRDINNYYNTLNRVVDKKIAKQDYSNDKELQKLHEQHNKIQQQRQEVIKNLLTGYGSNFIDNFIEGKQAILGYSNSFSITSAREITLEQLLNKSERTNTTPKQYLKQEIKSLEQDLVHLQSRENSNAYMIDQIKTLIENEGYTLSDRNLRQIEQKLSSVDWLGSHKIAKAIEGKIETGYYKKYDLAENDNRELMDSIFSDISRARHNNMIIHARINEL